MQAATAMCLHIDAYGIYMCMQLLITCMHANMVMLHEVVKGASSQHSRHPMHMSHERTRWRTFVRASHALEGYTSSYMACLPSCLSAFEAPLGSILSKSCTRQICLYVQCMQDAVCMQMTVNLYVNTCMQVTAMHIEVAATCLCAMHGRSRCMYLHAGLPVRKLGASCASVR